MAEKRQVVRIKEKIEGAFDVGGVQGVVTFLKKHVDLGKEKIRKTLREVVHDMKEKGADGASELDAFYGQMFPAIKKSGSALRAKLRVSKGRAVTVRLPPGFANAGDNLAREERVIDGRRVVMLLGPAVEAPAAPAE